MSDRQAESEERSYDGLANSSKIAPFPVEYPTVEDRLSHVYLGSRNPRQKTDKLFLNGSLTFGVDDYLLVPAPFRLPFSRGWRKPNRWPDCGPA